VIVPTADAMPLERQERARQTRARAKRCCIVGGEPDDYGS
jgi:hypothetical protein